MIHTSERQVFFDVELSKTHNTLSSLKANVAAVSLTVDIWGSDTSPASMFK